MDNNLTIFIAITAIAVLLQAGVLLAMFIVMRSTTAKMEALASEMKTKVFPVIEQTHSTLTEVRPTIETVAADVKESVTIIKEQVLRTDAVVNDIMDRARLQVIRADELLTRTMDRVENASDAVQNTVMSPVRHLSGLMQGISVGLEFLFSGRDKQNGNRRERRPVPQDEMFI